MIDNALFRRVQTDAHRWLRHYDQQHQCCVVAAEGDRCGLWCGHDADHVPYTPGDYLPTPLLHPLDVAAILLWGFKRCPLCKASVAFRPWGNVVTGWYCEGPTQVWRLTGPPAWVVGPEWQWEYAWRFEPCGCEGRELLPQP
ncbi:hypothetical protein ACWCRD_02915 [Streptomyces sp. NPDC002092]